MTGIDRVRRTRTILVATVLASGILCGALLFGVLLLLAIGLDTIAPLSLGARRVALPVAVALAGIIMAHRWWRSRRVRYLGAVALWLEERVPAFGFALITAVEPAGARNSEVLERSIAMVEPRGILAKPVGHAVGLPAIGTLLCLLVLLLLPRSALERVIDPAPGDILKASGRAMPAGGRLARVVVHLTPPAYSGRPDVVLENPSSVSGLVGSGIVMQGRGAARGEVDRLALLAADGRRPIRALGDTWSVSLTMPREAEAVRLVDGEMSRLLTLEPRIDDPPAVTLTSPLRDTTYASPTGNLLLRARLTDDVGLERGWFEVMRTSGAGERFSTTVSTAGVTHPGGATTAELALVVRLDTLLLGPGDVLNLRALARDRNNLTGPGEGSSDTRTIRIADPALKNAMRIVPAASAVLDTTVLSQRMLIIRAESLLIRRRRLAPQRFHDQSVVLGERQGMLLDRVRALIDDLETATAVGYIGETPESRMFREAADAMQQARGELALARVSAALPSMYLALRALDRARNAERLYLRGFLPRLVVDLDQVRLKGTDTAAVGARLPRPALRDARQALLDRLDRVLALGNLTARERGDSLTLIRVAALGVAPETAPTLDAAVSALLAARDPAPFLTRIRRTLARSTRSAPSLLLWGISP